VATAPQYAVTARAMCGLVPSTADTSWTAPTHVTSLGSAGANGGTKIAEIDVTPVGTTVAGIVNIFLYDGSAYHLLPGGSVLIAAATPSTTVAPVPQQFYFDNLVIPTGWSLAVSNTVAGNVSLVEVCAFGADL
jgi:hypothetical protein